MRKGLAFLARFVCADSKFMSFPSAFISEISG